jgi:prepilin-type processing-associated H-X9-DG protein
LADPGRTPLVAPCDNFFFRYDTEQLKTFGNSTLKDFLSNGKLPVLFVDGHVETISPSEYEERKLYLVPIVPPVSE